jgi:hypothetical protein
MKKDSPASSAGIVFVSAVRKGNPAPEPVFDIGGQIRRK